MKKIEAILRAECFEKVKTSLAKAGFIGLTTYEVKGRGRQKGIILSYKGREYREDLLPKIKIEVVVKTVDVDKVVDIIQSEARSGEIGDGKIFISSVDDVIRIRTGERGEEAI